MIKLLPLTVLASSLCGCGTQQLREHDYIEVGRGERALLITNNRETLDLFGTLLDSIFGATKDKKDLQITSVDNGGIDKKFFKENQHVLLLPGEREIGFMCSTTYEEKSKLGITLYGSTRHAFEGGYVYQIDIVDTTGQKCEVRIELEKHRYNKRAKPSPVAAWMPDRRQRWS